VSSRPTRAAQPENRRGRLLRVSTSLLTLSNPRRGVGAGIHGVRDPGNAVKRGVGTLEWQRFPFLSSQCRSGHTPVSTLIRSTLVVFLAGWIGWFALDTHTPDYYLLRQPPPAEDLIQELQFGADLLKPRNGS
jgi:hypothetical protein